MTREQAIAYAIVFGAIFTVVGFAYVYVELSRKKRARDAAGKAPR
jgi:predicted permease